MNYNDLKTLIREEMQEQEEAYKQYINHSNRAVTSYVKLMGRRPAWRKSLAQLWDTMLDLARKNPNADDTQMRKLNQTARAAAEQFSGLNPGIVQFHFSPLIKDVTGTLPAGSDLLAAVEEREQRLAAAADAKRDADRSAGVPIADPQEVLKDSPRRHGVSAGIRTAPDGVDTPESARRWIGREFQGAPLWKLVLYQKPSEDGGEYFAYYEADSSG